MYTYTDIKTYLDGVSVWDDEKVLETFVIMINLSI